MLRGDLSGFFDIFPDAGYICAHRGARSIAPENTLLALELAHRSGADLWETDVQMTADEELVLFHDRALRRTTDISTHQAFAQNRYRWLRHFTLAELRRLDAGSWFLIRDPFGTNAGGEVDARTQVRIPGQSIPTLREALDYCRTHNFPVNLEIKGKLSTARMYRRIELLLQLLYEMKCENLVLLSSFHHEELKLIKQLRPSLATAALVENRHPENLVAYLTKLQVAAYHPAEEMVDAALIALLAAAGIRVNTWTVNESKRMDALCKLGATFICTDWPQRMSNRRQCS